MSSRPHLLLGALLSAALLQPAEIAYAGELRCEEGESICWQPQWKKMRPWERVVASTLMLGAFAGRLLDPQTEETWTRDVKWDLRVSEALEVKDQTTVEAMRIYAHATYGLAMLYPAIDAFLVAGAIHRDWEVASQMAWFDFESFAVVASSLWVTQLFVGRERPGVRRCGEPGRVGTACSADSPEKNRSFYAGHAAIVLTSAATRCVHHAQLPLYGGGLADRLPCWGMLALGAGNAVSRVVTGAHYPSDVLVGAAVGLGAGYLLPRALHYGFGEETVIAFVPWSDGRGVALTARF